MSRRVKQIGDKMVKIAIAGGTGGLGRAIVDELETNQYHDYIILTRKVSLRSSKLSLLRASSVDEHYHEFMLAYI